jgi:hypothetical protein
MVISDNPRPDKYIPIFVGPAHQHIKPQGKVNRYKLFRKEISAIKYATSLKLKYGVAHIRLFYLGSHSKKYDHEKERKN